MEARVKALEDFALDTRDQLARIETKLDSFPGMFATKADLAEMGGSLRAELQKAISDQTWKVIGAMVTFGTLLTASVYFIARNVY